MPPKIIIFILPKFLLLISIVLFIYSFASVWEPIQAFLILKFPKISSVPYTFAEGIVTKIDKVRSDSYSYRDGRSTSSYREQVTIEFRDENNVPFTMECMPLFNTFKPGKKLKMLYQKHFGYFHYVEEYKKSLSDNNPDNSPTIGHLEAIPLSLFYWLQKPLFFGGIACLLLFFRMVFKHLVTSYPF